MMLVPVVLSGGFGKRLWPLSDQAHPKQLLALVTQHSLLQDTVLRLSGLDKGACGAPIVVCNRAHGPLIHEQLAAIDRTASLVVYEPEGRNTAPAAAVAALLTEQLYPAENPALLVLPADHAIQRVEAFAKAVAVARDAAEQGCLVTFGVLPDRPETEYGYIRRGPRAGDYYLVDRFVEKPDAEHAQDYVASGEYFWNSGMFLFKAAAYLAELESFAPQLLTSCRQAVAMASRENEIVRLGHEAFASCPSDSIDYAVMEHTGKAAVVPLDAGWSDVGSWRALYDLCRQDAEGNVHIGNTVTLDCRASYFRSADRLVAGIGLEGYVVVDTPNAVLIAPKDRAQDIRRIVEQLERVDGGNDNR